MKPASIGKPAVSAPTLQTRDASRFQFGSIRNVFRTRATFFCEIGISPLLEFADANFRSDGASSNLSSSSLPETRSIRTGQIVFMPDLANDPNGRHRTATIPAN